jgi:hypothetical protein
MSCCYRSIESNPVFTGKTACLKNVSMSLVMRVETKTHPSPKTPQNAANNVKNQPLWHTGNQQNAIRTQALLNHPDCQVQRPINPAWPSRSRAPTASTSRPPLTPPTWDRLPSLSLTFSPSPARKDRLLESISNVMNIAGTEYLIKLKNLRTYHPLEPGHQNLRESFAIFAV